MRTVAIGWITVVLIGFSPATEAVGQGNDGDTGCPVLAVAQGVQVTVKQADNLLIGTPTGVGVPVARACVDYDVRDSHAYASSPYPGQSVISAPGLVSGQTGQELPDNPAYAASHYPSKRKASASQPGVSLVAGSAETSSHARASHAVDQAGAAGGPSAVATVDTTVDPSAGTSTAKAKADLQPITINDVLALGEVVSTATATRTSKGAVRRDSQLRIGRTTVGGQEVVITPDGVQAAGQATPLPETPPTDALEEAGIRVRYLKAEHTKGGVLSPGVDVTVRQEDPVSGAVTTVHYVLGRSFATVAPIERGLGGGSGDLPSGLPDVSAPPGGGTAGAEGLASGPAPAPEAAEAPPPSVAAAEQLLASPADMGAAGLYLVLMLGGLVMFASATLLRLLGVKTRWTS